jgi:hypothetical protein
MKMEFFGDVEPRWLENSSGVMCFRYVGVYLPVNMA